TISAVNGTVILGTSGGPVGSVTETGTITTKTLTGFSNSSVALNQANAISNLSAFTASSGFALTNGQTLNTNGTVDAGSGGLSLTTTAGGINVFRPLTASSGTVTLTAAGSIVEDVTFGVITATTLTGSTGAGGAILIGNNLVTNLGTFSVTAGDLTFINAKAFATTGVLSSTGDITLVTTSGG